MFTRNLDASKFHFFCSAPNKLLELLIRPTNRRFRGSQAQSTAPRYYKPCADARRVIHAARIAKRLRCPHDGTPKNYPRQKRRSTRSYARRGTHHVRPRAAEGKKAQQQTGGS